MCKADALKAYFKWHENHGQIPAIPDDVEGLPFGWALYCDEEPLALVTNDGAVQFLDEHQWETIHAVYS